MDCFTKAAAEAQKVKLPPPNPHCWMLWHYSSQTARGPHRLSKRSFPTAETAQVYKTSLGVADRNTIPGLTGRIWNNCSHKLNHFCVHLQIQSAEHHTAPQKWWPFRGRSKRIPAININSLTGKATVNSQGKWTILNSISSTWWEKLEKTAATTRWWIFQSTKSTYTILNTTTCNEKKKAGVHCWCSKTQDKKFSSKEWDLQLLRGSRNSACTHWTCQNMPPWPKFAFIWPNS